jgi:hypothetical protein
MTSDESEQERSDADAPDGEIDGIDAVENHGDTEGHSLLTLELGGTIERERAREAEKTGRDRARAREARPKDDHGFFKRFRRG